jgi:hypothetical protein
MGDVCICYGHLVHHPVNLDDRDDLHPLAHAMASDFSVSPKDNKLLFRYGSNSTQLHLDPCATVKNRC